MLQSWQSGVLGWFAAAGDQLLLLPTEEAEQRQGKAFPWCQGLSCPAWGCWVGLQPPGTAVTGQQVPEEWHCLLSTCPGSCPHGPATCCQSCRVCTDPSVGTEQAFSACFAIKEHFSISALLRAQLPALLVPCGTAVQAAFVAGSHTLQTDIALPGVQLLFLFAFFFFTQRLFRVWICYCQSLKAGIPTRAGLWMALTEALLQDCQIQQGIQRRKSLSVLSFLKPASYSNVREHPEGAARAASPSSK